MDNIKFYLVLIFNFILIIILGCIAYNIKKDDLVLTAFVLLTVIGLISFIIYWKNKHRRFLKMIEEKDLLNIAEINFNQWYLNNKDKQQETYWVGLEKLTLFQISLEIMGETKVG